MTGYKIFTINPGSTSTKLGFFEDKKLLFETSVTHQASVLNQFETIADQLEYRKKVIREFLKENEIDLGSVDAIVGRGGSCYSVHGGVYEVDEHLVRDTLDAKGGIHHPSNLGPALALDLAQGTHARVFMLDPVCVDEFNDVARITGVKGIYRKAISHALNQKGVAMHYCKRNGLSYQEKNLIVCHIDGGITVSAHEKGRMVDGNNGAGGDGPFTPTRTGSIAITDWLAYMDGTDGDREISETIQADGTQRLVHNFAEVRKLCAGHGGFVSWFDTSDSDEVHAMVEAGDPTAVLVWQAMIYNICKYIGSMAVVLKGKVDAILLTGRLLRFPDIQEGIEDQCGWIAPIFNFYGEVESDAMAAGARRVLSGKEEAKIYTGKPVWTPEELDKFRGNK